MTLLEWITQGALLTLLGAAIPFAWRLERRLAALRAEGAAVSAGADGLAEATRAAEATLARLRQAAEASARSVTERVTAAESLRDDLNFLTERAEALADRLDALVRTARPLTDAAASGPALPAPAPTPRSEAERDLLRALRGGR